MAKSNIVDCGPTYIHQSIIAHAHTIKHENYKTNTTKQFQKHQGLTSDCAKFMALVGGKINIHPSKMDMVYFSVAKGAEPHTDLLDPNVFTNITYVIPVILPKGDNTIYADGDSAVVDVGRIYRFDHTKTHSMTVANEEDGAVLIMIAIKH